MLVDFCFLLNEDFAEGILQRVWRYADRWIVGIELLRSSISRIVAANSLKVLVVC